MSHGEQTLETAMNKQVTWILSAVAALGIAGGAALAQGTGSGGSGTPAPPNTTASAVFGMTKVDGEWRIKLPDDGFGLWLLGHGRGIGRCIDVLDEPIA